MESFVFCAVQPLTEIVQQGLVAKSQIVFLLLWQVENLQMSWMKLNCLYGNYRVKEPVFLSRRWLRWSLMKVIQRFTIPWDRNYNWPGIKLVFQESLGKIKGLQGKAEKSLWWGACCASLGSGGLAGHFHGSDILWFYHGCKAVVFPVKGFLFDEFSWLLELRNWISDHHLVAFNVLDKHKCFKYLMVFWLYLASISWCTVFIKIFKHCLAESISHR